MKKIFLFLFLFVIFFVNIYGLTLVKASDFGSDFDSLLNLEEPGGNSQGGPPQGPPQGGDPIIENNTEELNSAPESNSFDNLLDIDLNNNNNNNNNNNADINGNIDNGNSSNDNPFLNSVSDYDYGNEPGRDDLNYGEGLNSAAEIAERNFRRNAMYAMEEEKPESKKHITSTKKLPQAGPEDFYLLLLISLFIGFFTLKIKKRIINL